MQASAYSWFWVRPRKLVDVSQSFDLRHMLATFFLRVTLLNLKKGLSSFVICPVSLKLPVVWIAVWPIVLELYDEFAFGLACGYAVLSFLNEGLISEAGDFHLSRHQEIHLVGLVRLSLSSNATVRGEKSFNNCR
ncbi:hypothetical protein D3C77_240540 [compost metagenome]